jgi:hypothetical protein
LDIGCKIPPNDPPADESRKRNAASRIDKDYERREYQKACDIYQDSNGNAAMKCPIL